MSEYDERRCNLLIFVGANNTVPVLGSSSCNGARLALVLPSGCSSTAGTQLEVEESFARWPLKIRGAACAFKDADLLWKAHVQEPLGEDMVEPFFSVQMVGL